MLILNRLGARISDQLSPEWAHSAVLTPNQPRPPLHPVSGLKPEHLRACAGTLARALERDPMTPYLFGSATTRRGRLQFVFQAEIRYALRHGIVETGDDAGAVAIWIGPGEIHGGLAGLMKVWPATTLFHLGPLALWRGIRLLGVLHELRSSVAPRDHRYLLALGVHPEHQGKGWGSALLDHGIAQAQRLNLPCYLETTNRRNLSFYQRHGFRLAGTRPIVGARLTAWAMLRPGP